MHIYIQLTAGYHLSADSTSTRAPTPNTPVALAPPAPVPPLPAPTNPSLPPPPAPPHPLPPPPLPSSGNAASPVGAAGTGSHFPKEIGSASADCSLADGGGPGGGSAEEPFASSSFFFFSHGFWFHCYVSWFGFEHWANRHGVWREGREKKDNNHADRQTGRRKDRE